MYLQMPQVEFLLSVLSQGVLPFPLELNGFQVQYLSDFCLSFLLLIFPEQEIRTRCENPPFLSVCFYLCTIVYYGFLFLCDGEKCSCRNRSHFTRGDTAT